MMNPDTNMFEEVEKVRGESGPKYQTTDGKPIPKNSTIFEIGEQLRIRGYIFQVERFEGSEMVLKGVGNAVKGRIVTRTKKKSKGSSKRKRKSGNPRHK